MLVNFFDTVIHDNFWENTMNEYNAEKSDECYFGMGNLILIGEFLPKFTRFGKIHCQNQCKEVLTYVHM